MKRQRTVDFVYYRDIISAICKIVSLIEELCLTACANGICVTLPATCPTIILFHPVLGIYSLYGHLAIEDLEGLSVGMPIAAGQLLCHLGEPSENGGWPPHLHFQLIRDMQGYSGDYPGVCSPRDLPFYSENCPDPVTFYIPI